MRRRLLLAGLGALLATGCATTVSGNGTLAEDAPRPTGSGPSDRPSPSNGNDDPGSGERQSLNCEGDKIISPRGAPYCFAQPDGFQDVSETVTVDATVGNEKYRSAVAVGDRDLIIVTVYELRINTDPVSDEMLESELRGVLANLSTQGFAFDSTVAKRGTVDGARSFGYHAQQAKERLEADVYFIFRGKSEVEVNCQWKDKRAQIQRACDDVLGSLQIKSVT